MDFLNYYAMKKLDLTDIQLCVSQAGYENGFQYDPIESDTLLYVLFNPKRLPNYQSYWQWKAVESVDIDSAGIDPETWDVISPIWDNVQSIFSIKFPMMDMEDFGLMMKEVMVCHGGYADFENNLFDLDNILSIQDYIPKPPDDLLD